MKKVLKGWDCFVAIALLATTAGMTGCPEGDDDADADCPLPCATGYVCLYGDCVPVEADADADADTDTAETEDGTPEDTSDEGAANCSNVVGEWRILYLPVDRYTLYLEQVGCHLTGEEDYCTYTGEINEDDSLTLIGDCGALTQDLTGNLVSPGRMAGNWSRSSGTSGTWEADLQ